MLRLKMRLKGCQRLFCIVAFVGWAATSLILVAVWQNRVGEGWKQHAGCNCMASL